ncbi:MAG: PDDEXK nuclease domain-containing protein [Anaerolineales bacterium]
MIRYWIIAPFDSTLQEIWEKVWQFDLNNNIISIGWREIGDVSSLGESELRTIFQETYGHTKSFNMVWNFYHNIQVGDIVIARRGRKKIAAIGTVTKQAYFDATKAIDASGAEHVYPNHLDIRWHDAPRNLVFDRIVFGMQAVSEVNEEKFRELVGETHDNIVEKADSDIEDVTEFVLEKYLEDFMVSNFAAIFRGELVLYHDPEENVIGQQYTTDVGIIDILAQESNSKSFVVIELKKGRESDKVVGQILRYMGWVKENLCKNGQDVKGIVICRESDTRLSYALAMTSNIVIKYYRIDFKLEDIPLNG